MRAMVVNSQLLKAGRTRRSPSTYHLEIVLDRAAPALLLRAESGLRGREGIEPLGESRSADEPEAHGYTDNPNLALAGEGEAPDPDEVVSFAASQEAAREFAAQKVDVIARQRAKTMGNRVREALMQARAHGVDARPHIEAIDAQLRALHEEVRRAA